MEDFKVELKTKPGLMHHPEGRGDVGRKGAGRGRGKGKCLTHHREQQSLKT